MGEYNTPNNNHYPPQQPYNQQPPSGQDEPGKGLAIGSLVLGIIAVVLWFFGYSAIVSVILGIIGLILASNSKKSGYQGGMRTAGFILSLIGLIGGAFFFIACVACVGTLGLAGAFNY